MSDSVAVVGGTAGKSGLAFNESGLGSMTVGDAFCEWELDGPACEMEYAGNALGAVSATEGLFASGLAGDVIGAMAFFSHGTVSVAAVIVGNDARSAEGRATGAAVVTVGRGT